MAAPGPKPRDPSPAEIEQACAEIRRTWTERTYRIRSGWSAQVVDSLGEWVAPQYHLGELDLPHDFSF